MSRTTAVRCVKVLPNAEGSKPGTLRLLKQITKLFDREARISSNAAQGKRIDRVVARNRHDTLAVAHDDVFALAHNPKPGLFQSAYRVKVIDAGNSWQN